MTITTDPNDPGLHETKSDGQNKAYLVLSEEERGRGFVRPLRMAYLHVGPTPPKYPLRELTPEELEKHKPFGYTHYEEYPESEAPLTGRYWTKTQLVNKGCGTETKMAPAIAETYARNPAYYGATFCVFCRAHYKVGAQGEFVWTGTNERVGT